MVLYILYLTSSALPFCRFAAFMRLRYRANSSGLISSAIDDAALFTSCTRTTNNCLALTRVPVIVVEAPVPALVMAVDCEPALLLLFLACELTGVLAVGFVFFFAGF
jgi:hypothetical protein